MLSSPTHLEGDVGDAHSQSEPREDGVDEGEQSDEGDQVRRDVRHQHNRLRGSVGGRLDDVVLLAAGRRELSGSRQGAVREPSGSRQGAVTELSVRCQHDRAVSTTEPSEPAARQIRQHDSVCRNMHRA